jgi:hypothetical protein
MPQVCSSKITSPSDAVRNQAASALAALALASPPLAAKLLGSYLEAVEAGAQTLQMLAAPYSKPGVVGSSRLGPGARGSLGPGQEPGAGRRLSWLRGALDNTQPPPAQRQPPARSLPPALRAGPPRAAPDSQTRAAVDALQGYALAVAALLVASTRSALGVPSRLPRSAFWIAKRMILQVGPRSAFSKLWGPASGPGGNPAPPAEAH